MEEKESSWVSLFGKVGANLALGTGALYTLGVAVTAIHLNRFHVFDISLTQVTYLLTGAVCAFYVAIRISVAFIWRNRVRLLDELNEKRGDIEAQLKKLKIFSWLFEKSKLSVEKVLKCAFWIIMVVIIGIAAWGFVITLDLNCIMNENDSTFISLLINRVVLQGLALETLFVGWFYVQSVFKGLDSLRSFWRVILLLLVAADVIFYSFAIQPLVRPGFGGGEVHIVEIVTDSSWVDKLLAMSTDSTSLSNSDKASCCIHELDSLEFYLLHAAPQAYYLTRTYTLDYTNYKKWRFKEIIYHENVFRIKRDLVQVVEVRERY